MKQDRFIPAFGTSSYIISEDGRVFDRKDLSVVANPWQTAIYPSSPVKLDLVDLMDYQMKCMTWAQLMVYSHYGFSPTIPVVSRYTDDKPTLQNCHYAVDAKTISINGELITIHGDEFKRCYSDLQRRMLVCINRYGCIMRLMGTGRGIEATPVKWRYENDVAYPTDVAIAHSSITNLVCTYWTDKTVVGKDTTQLKDSLPWHITPENLVRVTGENNRFKKGQFGGKTLSTDVLREMCIRLEKGETLEDVAMEYAEGDEKVFISIKRVIYNMINGKAYKSVASDFDLSHVNANKGKAYSKESLQRMCDMLVDGSYSDLAIARETMLAPAFIGSFRKGNMLHYNNDIVRGFAERYHDRIDHGAKDRGRPAMKLNFDQVRIIKELLEGSNLTNKEIARIFNVEPETVRKILRNMVPSYSSIITEPIVRQFDAHEIKTRRSLIFPDPCSLTEEQMAQAVQDFENDRLAIGRSFD